jgi:signal transduction histidine kinase
MKDSRSKKVGSRAQPGQRKVSNDVGNADSAKEQRPSVLERRKRPHLPADAENQIHEFQALAQRLLEQREQEHQDISRELHDNIAQVISAATTRISLAREDTTPAWLRQELLDLRDQLQSALADVRTLARDLRPSALDHFGFAAALAKHADGFRERTRMTLEVRIEPEALGFLGNGDMTHLFRLTQEALQNIEEHSGASRAWIALSQRDGAMHLEIGDDGRSFTPERVTEAQRDGHLGLLGMRERAQLLGGNFLLEAAPERGTTIRVTVPVRENSGGDNIEFHL